MKLGRNEPCWCKSGKKYKRCHLGRSDAQSIPLSEALNATKQAQKGGACSCPNEMISECSGDPIRSHSISKALGLSKISDNGHVLTLKSDIKTLSKNKGKIQVGKIGINKMSIFPGFCSFHDKKFFGPFEDHNFTGSKEQCALLSYRALARERHAKIAGMDVNEFLKSADRGKSLSYQMMIQSMLSEYGLGLSLATDDLDRALESHHNAIINNDFGGFTSLILEFPHSFPILCSTGHMPSDDWSGKIVQDLTDPKLKADWLTAVSFHSDEKSWVVFTWLDKCQAMADFVDTLLENFKEKEADALIKYFFSISENIAISPMWWESLSERQKSALLARSMDGIPISGGQNITAPKKGEPIVLEMPLLSSRRV